MSGTSLKQQYREFLQLESSLDVYQRTMDDVYYWEYIRPRVFLAVARGQTEFRQAHHSTTQTTLARMKRIARSTTTLGSKNPFTCPERDILVLNHPRRKLEEDDLWWDIYTDPLLDDLDSTEWVALEPSYEGGHRTPSKTEDVRYLDLIESAHLLYSKFSLDRKGEIRTEVRDLRRGVKERFDVSIDIGSLVNEVLTKRRVFLPLYKRIVQRVDPSVVVLTVGGYRKHLIEACKSLGIPVVEMQHGAAHKFNPVYEFPEWATVRAFPDRMFVFGESWKQHVAYPINNSCVRSVGFPYHERMAKEYEGVSKKDQILVASQGTIGNELSKVAVELQTGTTQYDVIYKLHPGEYLDWEQRYPQLVRSDVTVIDSDTQPLYKLLAESRILVGVYSSVMCEGANMGLDTYVVNLTGHNVMRDLNESCFTFVSSAEEILDSVRNRPVSSQRHALFRKNSIQRIREELQEFL